MLSDDVYRSKFNSTVESLRYWVPSISDAARAEEASSPDYWKLSVTPHVEGACPFELLLSMSQMYDVMIAGEIYEDIPVTSLDLFVPLAEAISEGRVIQRRYVSPMTGTVREVETIVTLADGKVWRKGHLNEAVAAAIAPGSAETIDRAFLPYRR